MMKEIVFGLRPKISKFGYSKEDNVAMLTIFDAKNCQIGDEILCNEDNFDNKLCTIYFGSKEDVQELYYMININKTIFIENEDIYLIFLNNRKSVNAFKDWLSDLMSLFDGEKD